MTDMIEHELSATLRERALSTPVPPVPQALLGLPVRPRRRLVPALAVAAAAAVVAGVSLGAAMVTDRSGEGPVAEAPTLPASPTAPAIPYLHDGVLHVGSVTATTTADELWWEGDTVVVTDVFHDQQDGETARSWILRGDDLVPLPYLDDTVVDALSLDGTQVASQSHPEPGATRLVVHDLAQGTEVGSVDVGRAGRCCRRGGLEVRGFDTSGRVLLNDGGVSFVFDPERAGLAGDTGVPGVFTQVGPQGVLVQADGSSPRRVLGELDEDGAFEAVRTFRMPDTTETAAWSPSGETVAYSSNAGPVVEPRDGSTAPVPLDLGDRRFRSFAGFESETDLLLVAASGDRYDLLRCTVDGDCEVVTAMGDVDALSDWVFPRL